MEERLLSNSEISLRLSMHDKQLDKHDKKFETYDERIDRLEKGQAKLEVILENLCNKLDSLTSALKWLIGTLLVTFIGFFIYAIQQSIF